MRPNQLATGQLDLFAEAQAAEQQRRATEAPTLFDTGQQGYFARLAALEQWKQDYGNFACCQRSHAWHPELTAKGEQHPRSRYPRRSHPSSWPPM